MGLSTSVLRPAILTIAHDPWFRRLASGTAPGRAVASRFVAGETLAEALAAAREIRADGLLAMLNHLGENVATAQEALAAREAYLSEVAAVQAQPELDLVVSMKLTQLGLGESVDACWANLVPILDAAAAAGIDAMIDMEDHRYVDDTLAVLARAHERYDRTGIVLQAYLRRTPDDLFALPAGCRLRLVKGAYLEPREVAFQRRSEVDRAFRQLFTTAFARGHRMIDLATHDPEMIRGALERVGADRSRVEVQMLYGVRRDLQASLAAEGVPVRVYIPYGTDWYPYLTRRLAERPANLWFFASNLMRTAR